MKWKALNALQKFPDKNEFSALNMSACTKHFILENILYSKLHVQIEKKIELIFINKLFWTINLNKVAEKI